MIEEYSESKVAGQTYKTAILDPLAANIAIFDQDGAVSLGNITAPVEAVGRQAPREKRPKHPQHEVMADIGAIFVVFLGIWALSAVFR